jgi:(1->4)-alpha-D-glucan 1-alpha-D-glucosylmutase
VLVLVPRLVWKLSGNWGDTTLEIPPGAWRNELTGGLVQGGSVRIADLLELFPAALLTSGIGDEISKSN